MNPANKIRAIADKLRQLELPSIDVGETEFEMDLATTQALIDLRRSLYDIDTRILEIELVIRGNLRACYALRQVQYSPQPGPHIAYLDVLILVFLEYARQDHLFPDRQALDAIRRQAKEITDSENGVVKRIADELDLIAADLEK